MARTHAVSKGSMKMPRVLVLWRPTVSTPVWLCLLCTANSPQTTKSRVLELSEPSIFAVHKLRAQFSTQASNWAPSFGIWKAHSFRETVTTFQDSILALLPATMFLQFWLEDCTTGYFAHVMLWNNFTPGLSHVLKLSVCQWEPPFERAVRNEAHFQRFLEVCWLTSSTLLPGKRLVLAQDCRNQLRAVEMNLTSTIWPVQYLKISAPLSPGRGYPFQTFLCMYEPWTSALLEKDIVPLKDHGLFVGHYGIWLWNTTAVSLGPGELRDRKKWAGVSREIEKCAWDNYI